jgi:hypothetical protein
MESGISAGTTYGPLFLMPALVSTVVPMDWEISVAGAAYGYMVASKAKYMKIEFHSEIQ